MLFKRKVYDKLLEWKKLYSDRYAALLEGARLQLTANSVRL